MLDQGKSIISQTEPRPVPVSEQPARPSIKKLIPSFIASLQDFSYGDNYRTIFGYWWPEVISALMLQSLLPVIDSLFVADLQSTSIYATLNVTNNFIHFMVKVAEGLAIGATVLSGQYNGIGNYRDVGKTVRDGFWMTVVVGSFFAGLLYLGAPFIYAWYGVPEKMITLGIPYLRTQSLRVFFMFLYLALIGFLRGIKNTKVPMHIFMVGGLVFVLADYVLIHGGLGVPALGFQGSAIASVIQYALMSSLALAYVVLHPDARRYQVNLLSGITDGENIKRIVQLSWPAIVDKSIFAAGYIWLGSMVTSMGKYSIATFGAIKDIERLAFVPAVAFAQVVTFLVSNAYSRGDWQGIKSNVKKILFLTVVMVAAILALFCCCSHDIIQLVDRKGKFTDFASSLLPYVSILAIFDIVQVILSGALRGAANVKTVMTARLIVILGYFVPVSYLLSRLPIQDNLLKFFLIYGSFYIGHAIMSLVFIQRFRGEAWKGTVV